ncbi:MAG TPA: outer membrane protein assembly factor BamA [Porphyromonadaceae bacterium]|nr:outer membrane protein assembly factor BamA [Porphyromonadaceae bacterium]
MRKILLLSIFLGITTLPVLGNTDSISSKEQEGKPEIIYSFTPKKYEIAGIKVTGAKSFDESILISYSGLYIGQSISIPGAEIPSAINRFWDNGLFSDVSIEAEKIEGNRIWIEIKLKQRARISNIVYHGIKKSDKEDLDLRSSLVKGNQVTPSLINKAQKSVKQYYAEKGFYNTEVTIRQSDDLSQEGYVIVDIYVNKKQKTGVHKIYTEGNYILQDGKLQNVMKKTNEKGKLVNIFRTKKFIQENYENDKKAILAKYNELGYRDATILWDSVATYNQKSVDIFLKVYEGRKYYVRDIRWIGNTLYSSEQLSQVLGINKGDVYNQRKLEQRTMVDEDGISNLYMDRGYLFFNLNPIELSAENDSVDLEMRISEGPPATINKIIINGSDRLYERVIRRELYTKPGALFSKSDVQRSAREIAQSGHFEPENMDIRPNPNYENGTVDINYNLKSKANDQIEVSLGWGSTGLIGRLGVKFTNFSVKNLFNKQAYKGVVPQGEGQIFSISAQTNARYYQAYSISFTDPWFGGKRPNSFSVSAYYSRQTDVSSNYGYNNTYYNYYNYYTGNTSSDYVNYADPNKSFQMFGVSVGFGKRLKWPDDYFVFRASLNYNIYTMNEWKYFIIPNGTCNNINFNFTLSRNSQDQPIYPRRGSAVSLSLEITPPYSFFDGKDYSQIKTQAEKNKWVEYYKWNFRSKFYVPLSTGEHTFVLMTRADFGYIGYFNKDKKSPFSTYYMGGDGMSGTSSTYATETVGLRGYANGSLTPYGFEGRGFARFAAEIRYPFLLTPSLSAYGLGFVEAGNAWSDMKDFNPFNLKRSAGVGLRLIVPMIGMIGIDWAYGFDPVFETMANSGSNVHFIIGQEF